MNLGAGRVVMQDLPRIDQAIADGTLAADPRARAPSSRKLQGDRRHRPPDGPDVARRRAFAPGPYRRACRDPVATPACRSSVHAFLDGRDTPPQERRRLSRQVPRRHRGPHGGIRSPPSAAATTPWTATSAGTASRSPTRPSSRREGERAADALAAVERSLCARRDRRVRPADRRSATMPACATATACCSPISAPTARARSCRRCSTRPSTASRARASSSFAAALGMIEYSTELNRLHDDALPAEDARATCSARSSPRRGLKQLRIAETEKYAHVTFFFNGGDETRVPRRGAHPGARRPRSRPTTCKPEMSAPRGDRQAGRGDPAPAGSTSSCVNYANTDMVGHTGDLAAARQGGGDGRRLPRPRRRGGRARRAAPCSSPPTTATPR